MTLLCQSCLTENPVMLPFDGLTPQNLDDGWEISTPESEGFDPEQLTEVVRKLHEDTEKSWQVRSLIISCNGHLIAETYTKDKEDINRPHAIWSCTKQILSIITLMAYERGLLPQGLETTVGTLPGNYPDDKRNITLLQLLTMTSGIGYDNSGLNGDTNKLLRREPPTSVDYVLSLPMRFQPGTGFNYNDGDPQVVTGILANAFETSVGNWSRNNLFRPMDIIDYDWADYPGDGVTMGAFGLRLKPRDLAKFGQLIINGGKWNNHRLLSEESVSQIITQHVNANQTGYCGQAFGLYWWIDPQNDMPYMHGQGGQYVFADRERNIVVCITSEPNTQGSHQYSLIQAQNLYKAIIATLRPTAP